MVRQHIHHDRKCYDMTCHAENEEQQLCYAYYLASGLSPKHGTHISHGVNMHMLAFYLSNNVSSICRENPNTDDHQNPAARMLTLCCVKLTVGLSKPTGEAQVLLVLWGERESQVISFLQS